MSVTSYRRNPRMTKGKVKKFKTCLLYTSDAADVLLCVDLLDLLIMKHTIY